MGTDVKANRQLAAGGSLPGNAGSQEIGARWRVRLVAEMAVLFVAAPLAIIVAVHGLRVPLFMMLPPVLLALVAYLLADRSFHVRAELRRGFPLSELGYILATFAVAATIVATVVAVWLPAQFLSFPRYAPRLWLFVMFAYPIASVLAQELIYRTFFFHRYGVLFGHRRWLAIAVNGALFGFAHIIFGSIVSVLLTAIAGFLLAYRYERTRSFWAVWLEHSLYGGLVWTVGLGRYFFTGVSGLG